MSILTNRTLRKGWPELLLAAVSFALTWVIDHGASLGLDPEVYGLVQGAAQVALQAVRRMARDRKTGQPA